MSVGLRSSKFVDLEYVRQCLPIRHVAEQLGLTIQGRMIRCWRPEKHQHNDRTPSVAMHETHNIAKCFVCDAKALSTIDLVMSVRGSDFPAAMDWILSRYQVPDAPKGKHIARPERWPERFQVRPGGPLHETLIRCGIWAELTPAQRSIIPVLENFAESSVVQISYRGLMRYAGVRSASTVSAALKRFCALGFLRVDAKRDADGLRVCNKYRFCPDDPHFVRIANECHRHQQEQITYERQLRKEARKNRAQLLRVNPLSNDCSASEFHAPVS